MRGRMQESVREDVPSVPAADAVVSVDGGHSSSLQGDAWRKMEGSHGDQGMRMTSDGR